MTQKDVNSVTAKRSFILLALFALAAFLLSAVIFKMQVVDYEKYQHEVIEQITVENSVAAERGTIYDRNMNVIATNQTYVESLKKQGKFDAEAQKVAFNQTYEAVMCILSEEAKEYLNEAVGDLNLYITQKIEAEVQLNKPIIT